MNMNTDKRNTDKRNTDSYIRAIAELKSVSAAADRLGVTQPALSASLKKKEQELGTLLFDRSKQPIELTEAGKAYLDYIEKQDQLASEMQQQLADIAGMQVGRLTVGGAIAFNIAYLPRAIHEFNTKYPRIDINILDRNVPELVNEALKGNVDLFLTPQNDDTDRFNYAELLEEKLLLCVPSTIAKELKLAHKRVGREEFCEMCKHTFVMLRDDQDVGMKMNELAEFYGCEPSLVVRAEQTLSTLAMSMSGVGISLISEGSMKNLNIREEDSQVKLYELDTDICKRKLYVAWPKNKYLSKSAEEFIRMLQEVNND